MLWTDRNVSDKEGLLEILVIFKQNSGYLYACGRDLELRPMLILNFRKLAEKGFCLQNVIKANHLLLEYVKREVLVPGRIETWDLLVDLEGVNSFKYPRSHLDSILNEMTRFYPSRLNLMIMINSPKMIRFLLKTSAFFKSKSESNLSIYCGKTYRDKLFKVISRKQLEIKYGGFCPNLLTNYFPPYY